jgi:ABC-type amino acid transport substrate-binding protein
VPFAAWFVGTELPAAAYPTLLSAGLASFFSSTTIAIPFLLDLVHLPNDLFQVFVTVDVINGRFGTMLSAMHVAAVGLIGALWLQGRVRMRASGLARLFAVTVLALVAPLLVVRGVYGLAIDAPYTMGHALKRVRLLVEPQPHTLVTASAAARFERLAPTELQDLRDRGALRVCFRSNDYPAAFMNDGDPPELVGFDIEMAHRFALSLGLPIQFVASANDAQAAGYLRTGACDVYMSAILFTPSNTARFLLSAPVMRSSLGLVVRDHRRHEFESWARVRTMGPELRLALPSDADARAATEMALPRATITTIPTRQEQEGLLASGAQEVDAIAALSELGGAWTLLYPDFTLVVPRPVIFVPVAYAVAVGNEDLRRALDAWLIALQSRGVVDMLYRYWMLGEALQIDRPPRWCIGRDVLHLPFLAATEPAFGDP